MISAIYSYNNIVLLRTRIAKVYITVDQVPIFTIVYMKHVMPINRPLVLLILFLSDYEGVGKAISVCNQFPAI